MYLAAIIPPNNAETAFLAVKREIFRETSALSAWALKPMIPFVITSAQPETFRRSDLPVLPPGGLAVDQLSEFNGQYVLSSEVCSNFCAELKMLFCTSADCFSGLHGLQIFDASDTEKSSREDIINTAERLITDLERSVMLWHSCSLSVFRVEPGILSTPGWWKRVVLETVQEIRFPKGSKPSFRLTQ